MTTTTRPTLVRAGIAGEAIEGAAPMRFVTMGSRRMPATVFRQLPERRGDATDEVAPAGYVLMPSAGGPQHECQLLSVTPAGTLCRETISRDRLFSDRPPAYGEDRMAGYREAGQLFVGA